MGTKRPHLEASIEVLFLRSAFLICALFAALTTGQASAEGSRVFDRVVATIEIALDGSSSQTYVLTASELEFETRVALVQGGGVAAAQAPLDDAVMKSALDYAIGQRLQAAEAEKLQVFALEEGEVDKALTQFEARIGGRSALEAFLQRHEADRQILGALLARALRAERILDSKIRLKAQVPDAEVRRYFDVHQTQLGGTFEELRAPLKEKLVRERYQALAKAEMQQLRKNANVRIIAPLEGGP